MELFKEPTLISAVEVAVHYRFTGAERGGVRPGDKVKEHFL
jgi:hypothetical protein